MARSCARAAALGPAPVPLRRAATRARSCSWRSTCASAIPGVRIVGGYSPPHRPLTDEERAAVIKEINGSRADVVWVGIGVPKQEKWMAEMRDELDAPVLIGVGAAFDFHAGLVPQAPEPGSRSPGWSGPTAWPTSRDGCGGATRATTRASSGAFARQLRDHRREPARSATVTRPPAGLRAGRRVSNLRSCQRPADSHDRDPHQAAARDYLDVTLASVAPAGARGGRRGASSSTTAATRPRRAVARRHGARVLAAGPRAALNAARNAGHRRRPQPTWSC